MHNIPPKEYLFIPSVPTPNGRLHLGHIGGPYLRADMLARYLRMYGHKAYIACGVDSYDSYVISQASKEKKALLDINNIYYKAIQNDLINMDIALDIFVNPLDPQWSVDYQRWCRFVFKELENKNGIMLVNEKMLWDQAQHHFVIGCWLVGQCPTCNSEVESYFCEKCCVHFKPQEMLHPYSKINQNLNLESLTVSNWFLKIPQVNITNIKSINVEIQQKFLLFLQQQENLMRLTTNNLWGIQLVDKFCHNYVYFNYGFVYAYFLMLGELIGQQNNIVNPFCRESSCINIASFGADNSIPFLSSIYGISSYCAEFKPFDHYLINYFYQLENSKFSTSRNHAIWAASAIENVKLSSDIIRMYLASVSVDSCHGSFNNEQFITFYNQLAKYINLCVSDSFYNIENLDNIKVVDSLCNKLKYLFDKQQQFLDPEQYKPQNLIAVIMEWFINHDKVKSPMEHYWWLKGLSVLVYPVMPKLGAAIWQALMQESMPRLKDFFIIKSIILQYPYHNNAIKFISSHELQQLYNNNQFTIIKE